MQPISVFMVSLAQLIFILAHPSFLFIVMLGLALSGFFVSLREQAEKDSFFIRAQVILCIECTYITILYIINVFRLELKDDSKHKQDVLILLGLGSEQ